MELKRTRTIDVPDVAIIENNFCPAPGLAVCMLITNMDSATGGIQIQSRRLLQNLDQRGVRTYVCARNHYHKARKEVLNGTFIQRSPVISGTFPALNSILYLVDALSWLIRNRKRYDVIHCQQGGDFLVGS
jgi:hypothetical protein